MNDPRYKEPETQVVSAESKTVPAFYIVSIRKFAVLYMGTLGIYGIYWFYRNWRLYRYVSGEESTPALRAIFNIFFVHALFKKIARGLEGNAGTFASYPMALATAYVLLHVTGTVLDHLAGQRVGSPATDVLSVFTPFVLCMVLIPAQRAINDSQNDPHGTSNRSFTVANIIWLVAGLGLWALIAVWILALLGVWSFDV